MVTRASSLPDAAIARQARCMSDQTGWKPALLVSEMPDRSEDHRHLAIVSGGDHFLVTNGAARLNRACCAGFGGGDQSVRERKKSVARDRTAFERKPSLVCFPNCYPRRIDPRHLTGANSKCPIPFRVYDCIRFHMFHYAPTEEHRVQFRLR